MHPATVACLLSLAAGPSLALKFGDLAQGAEFSQCIKITDFNSKSLADDVEVVDKADGCCPEGSIPGIKWYNQYWGSMIVCGFKDDGSVNMGTSTSNGVKSCEYNKCYVVKMDITCADDSKMKLDGCCPKDQWTADCKMYSKSQSFFNEKVTYCLSYAKKYTLDGTVDKTDDQVDGKLSLTGAYAYTGCAPFGGNLGGSGGSSSSPSPSPSSDTTASAAVQASVAVLGALGALVSILM